MKKIYKLVLIAIFLSVITNLIACGEKKPSDSTKGDTTSYNITIEKSDYYEFSGTTSSTSGETAIVSLKSNYPAYQIIGCTYNGNDCKKVSEDEEGNLKFEYEMPKSNVELKVLYQLKDTSVSGIEDFLCFDTKNNYSTTSAIDDSTYNNDEYWGTPLIINYDINCKWMTLADITIISANEDILPSDAIEIKNTLSSSSNEIVGGRIIIDRSKIKVGTAQIGLKVKNGNNNSYYGMIVATITIE